MGFDKKNTKVVYEGDGITIRKATKDNRFYKNPKIQTYTRNPPMVKKENEK